MPPPWLRCRTSASRYPEDQRGELHRRLLAIADDPHLHPGDLLDQAPTDPLSYVMFKSDSQDLAADALLVSASFAPRIRRLRPSPTD